MERQRQSIPIQGINRAESDDTVKDGACEDIYNFRYRAGVFENVRQPLLLHPITQSNGFSIVHRLDTMDQGEYLAEKEGALWRVEITNGTVTGLEQMTHLPGDADDVRYFHFGNVLYVNYTQGGILQELVFRYKDGAFNNLNFGTLVPPEMYIRSLYKSASKDQIPLTDGMGSGGTGSSGTAKIEAVKLAYVERYSTQPANNKDEYYYNVGLKEVTDEGYIPGTAFICAAYKLFDGSIIKPGKIQILSGDNGDEDTTTLYKYISEFSGSIASNNTTQKCTYFGRVCGVKPTVFVDIPDKVKENDLIQSVVILSTRNMTTYDFDSLHSKFGRENFPAVKIAGGEREMTGVWVCSHGCVQNDELIEPLGVLYELAEIKSRDGESSLELTYSEHYSNVEQQPVFSPNYSCHSTISGGKYEYNDRLHIHDLKTLLFGGYDPVLKSNETPDSRWNYHDDTQLTYIIDVNTRVDDTMYRIRKEVIAGYWTTRTGKDCLLFHNILSYPDSRAESVEIWVLRKGTAVLHKNIKLKASPGDNYASAILDSIGNGFAFYALFPMDNAINVTLPAPSTSLIVCQKNKIQVSYPSNPFVYAPANIYTVGGQGERIREIIATAERMTEVAYGYQPLLVFTNRATYALESGEGEVLYARNIPILSQSIVEGTNAVEGNGAVFFVSSSGIMAIVRGQISTISEPMRRWAGLIAFDATMPDFEKYTRASKLMFNRNESELIVYNPSYSYAYVYSLLGKYWTRREWDASVEPCFGEIITASGVASLFEEDLERPTSSCKLVTRPLKLGSTEYKRLETLAARIRWGEGSRFTLSIEGSDDAMRWVPLHAENNLPLIRRTPSSFRYHRIQLTGCVADYLAITHFDVEFYNKFVHKLR